MYAAPTLATTGYPPFSQVAYSCATRYCEARAFYKARRNDFTVYYFGSEEEAKQADELIALMGQPYRVGRHPLIDCESPNGVKLYAVKF